uniref:Uncharacterized protein n=1 Tax=Oryza punctata TaxID=4537 RepID=A0A0E0JL09_ORYPU
MAVAANANVASSGAMSTTRVAPHSAAAAATAEFAARDIHAPNLTLTGVAIITLKREPQTPTRINSSPAAWRLMVFLGEILGETKNNVQRKPWTTTDRETEEPRGDTRDGGDDWRSTQRHYRGRKPVEEVAGNGSRSIGGGWRQRWSSLEAAELELSPRRVLEHNNTFSALTTPRCQATPQVTQTRS